MRSVWLTQAMAADADARITPLDGDLAVDVAIVGGGYTGLWTAIELKRRDPSLDVAVIERDVCGAGGSGANAGFALPMWLQVPALERAGGTDAALHVGRASIDAIDDIRALATKPGNDIAMSSAPTVWAATCQRQSGHWDDMLDLMESRQIHSFRRLETDDVRSLTGSDALVAGVVDTASATLHPGHLVRALRREALSLEVRVLEKTAMTRLKRSTPPGVITPRGTLTARKVVLALYGWSLSLPEIRPALMVMVTDAAMTAPVPGLLDSLGIADAAGFTDSRTFIESCRPTADGRIVVTKSGGALPFGDRVDASLRRTRRSTRELHAIMAAYHPALADVAIEGTWCGPIDRSRDGLPMFGHLGSSPDIVFGCGYSGAGIVPSRVGSHILASLVQERDDAWSRSPLVRQPERAFPREPFRWIGGHAVRAAIERKDRLDHEGREPGPLTRFWLSFKPASYKPA